MPRGTTAKIMLVDEDDFIQMEAETEMSLLLLYYYIIDRWRMMEMLPPDYIMDRRRMIERLRNIKRK